MKSTAFFRLIRFGLILGGLACAAGDRAATAGLFFHHHEEGPPPPGCPRDFPHTHERAGFPLLISSHAKPTHTPGYVGYYVGGGTGWVSCPRRAEEGTWGRDFQGHWIPRHVDLQWGHGRFYQGGMGSYNPDGHPIPDVIGLTASRLRSH